MTESSGTYKHVLCSREESNHRRLRLAVNQLMAIHEIFSHASDCRLRSTRKLSCSYLLAR